MPFIVIAWSYRLLGRGSTGQPEGFEPDGDSIHFRPAKPTLFARLERIGQPPKLDSIGSIQLRLEGIDALEMHFGGSHQPRRWPAGRATFSPASSASTPCPTSRPSRCA